jgi:hypothetical protein
MGHLALTPTLSRRERGHLAITRTLSRDHAAHGARRGTFLLPFRIDAQNRASPLRVAAGGGIMAIRAGGNHE